MDEFMRDTWFVIEQQVTGYQRPDELFCSTTTFNVRNRSIALDGNGGHPLIVSPRIHTLTARPALSEGSNLVGDRHVLFSLSSSVPNVKMIHIQPTVP